MFGITCASFQSYSLQTMQSTIKCDGKLRCRNKRECE
jgi:hypothetical protein